MARQLRFGDFTEALDELERLHRGGYEKLGQWDLAQACDHLAYFIRGSLDGWGFRVPWLVKVLFGRLVLRRILKQKRMKAGVPTPQRPLPAPGRDEAAAVAGLRREVERLLAHAGQMCDSPFFGHLTPEQWRELHLIHCAHHLGFFAPRGGGA